MRLYNTIRGEWSRYSLVLVSAGKSTPIPAVTIFAYTLRMLVCSIIIHTVGYT